MAEALGMVECMGLGAMIEAADAMGQNGKRSSGWLGKDRRRIGYGDRARDVAAVRVQYDAGPAAGRKVGVVVATHVIQQFMTMWTTTCLY